MEAPAVSPPGTEELSSKTVSKQPTPGLHPSRGQMIRCRRCLFLTVLLSHCHPPPEPVGGWWTPSHTPAGVTQEHSGEDPWELTSLFQWDPADPRPHSPQPPETGVVVFLPLLMPERDRSALFGMSSLMPPSTAGDSLPNITSQRPPTLSAQNCRTPFLPASSRSEKFRSV